MDTVSIGAIFVARTGDLPVDGSGFRGRSCILFVFGRDKEKGMLFNVASGLWSTITAVCDIMFIMLQVRCEIFVV